MNTLYGQINSKQYMNTSEPIKENSKHEAVAVFNTLTLKENACISLRSAREIPVIKHLG